MAFSRAGLAGRAGGKCSLSMAPLNIYETLKGMKDASKATYRQITLLIMGVPAWVMFGHFLATPDKAFEMVCYGFIGLYTALSLYWTFRK